MPLINSLVLRGRHDIIVTVASSSRSTRHEEELGWAEDLSFDTSPSSTKTWTGKQDMHFSSERVRPLIV